MLITYFAISKHKVVRADNDNINHNKQQSYRLATYCHSHITHYIAMRPHLQSLLCVAFFKYTEMEGANITAFHIKDCQTFVYIDKHPVLPLTYPVQFQDQRDLVP